jgi:hypothetical protein
MLKISLDSASDSLVWLLALARGRSSSPGRLAAAQSSGEHFGRGSKGPAKVLAIAPAGRARSEAESWLLDLRERGLDVALITTEPWADDGLPTRRVAHMRPLAVLRAVQSEMDLRTVDAIVPVGGRAHLIARVLPPQLRPRIPGVEVEQDPERAAQMATEAVAGR